jgi:hypothetical protein
LSRCCGRAAACQPSASSRLATSHLAHQMDRDPRSVAPMARTPWIQRAGTPQGQVHWGTIVRLVASGRQLPRLREPRNGTLQRNCPRREVQQGRCEAQALGKYAAAPRHRRGRGGHSWHDRVPANLPAQQQTPISAGQTTAKRRGNHFARRQGGCDVPQNHTGLCHQRSAATTCATLRHRLARRWAWLTADRGTSSMEGSVDRDPPTLGRCCP